MYAAALSKCCRQGRQRVNTTQSALLASSPLREHACCRCNRQKGPLAAVGAHSAPALVSCRVLSAVTGFSGCLAH